MYTVLTWLYPMKKPTNMKFQVPSALQQLNAHLRRRQQTMFIWFIGALIIMSAFVFVW